MKLRQQFFLATIALFSVILAIRHAVVENRLLEPFTRGESVPEVMLWAWETSTDLTWIDAKRVGVAFLADTITLSDDQIWVKPRLEALNVPEGTYLTAVLRIDTDRFKPPTLSDRQLKAVINCIKQEKENLGARSLQIDFDARTSQRAFYRSLLLGLKRELPDDVNLSMTALASWCIGDRWLNDMSVDEIVPMFFSMGADKRNVLSYVRAGLPVENFKRRIAFGLSAEDQEALAVFSKGKPNEMLKGKRIYLFSGRGWKKAVLSRFTADGVGIL